MNISDSDFWEACDELVRSHAVTVDRPRGTRHPRHPDMVYPLDYGYLSGTSAGDGAGIDVWLGSDGDTGVAAIACTVDLLKRDAELKLLLGCTEDDIQLVNEFWNSTETLRCVVLRRPE